MNYLSPINNNVCALKNKNLREPVGKAHNDWMVVGQILALHKSLPLTRTPQERERLAGLIEATDRAIDALVYQP